MSIGRVRRRGAALASVATVLAAGLVAASVVPTAARAGAATRAAPRSCTAELCATWQLQIGKVWFTSPTFATIDGVRAVVAASLSGYVYVFNAVTHQPLPGWAGGRPAIIEGSTPTAIDSSPAVAYLDGPGKPPSIIVGTGSQWESNQNGGLIAWNANGSVRFIVHTHNTFNQWGTPNGGSYDNSVFATPAVGDFEGNGQLDIAFTSYDHYIYAVNSAGQMLPGFPIQRADTIWSSPMLVDASQTGRDDLIVGGDASGLDGCYGGWLTDYRWAGSGPTLEWEHCIGQTIWSSPTIGVLNSTGRPAVVVGTSFNTDYVQTTTSHEIFAWYADDGAPVPGWPVDAGGSCNDPSQFPGGGTFGSPAVGQITPSGGPVVISTSHAHCLKGPAVVTEWSGSGRQIWSQVINSSNDVDSSPAVVDMGNGINDVLVGSADGMLVLNGETGAIMYNTLQRPLQGGCDVASAPAVSPVPGSGSSGWEMVFNCGGPAWSYGNLVAYALPKAPSFPPMWSEWRANPDRTGVPDPLSAPSQDCSVPHDPGGYRLVTADAQEIADFGLPYCGDAQSEVLPVPVAGEAGTPDGGGYWLLLQDGTVYAFGNAHWYGDARNGAYHQAGGLAPPGAPMTGIASTANGKGYYLTDGMGDVYAFGNARYHGSESGKSIDGTIVGITLDEKTGGYWLYSSMGAVYAFGAPNHGSAATRTLRTPVVGMAALSNGSGYWLVTSVGTIFNYGVRSYGSIAHLKHEPVIGIITGAGGDGYYLAADDGGIFSLGKVHFYGSGVGKPHNELVVSVSGP